MSQNNIPKTSPNRNKVWVYFEQCDGDPNRIRCNLCSTELLCNKGAATTTSSSSSTITNILWNHVKLKHSIDKNTISTTNDDNSRLSQESSSGLIMAPTKLSRNTSKSKNSIQNSDFIDYNDLSITSMKPLPSSSLSKSLISRLNQLSSPVTRKLKFWNKKSFQVNQYDPSFKVIYLGNLGMQLCSKDESCLDKPLSTLWNNYLVNMKTEIVMRLTICNSGLKAITRQHGLTQYWSNRLVYCCSHKNYPRIFTWVYRHEGKKMRQELRCHAVFCPSPEKAAKMVTMLNQRLACALQEFRREKKSRGINLVNNISSSQHKLPRKIPLRRQILEKGSANFRPPLERSKSAPKLTSIVEEDYDSDEHDSHDEFEYEESFGDKDDDDVSDYNESRRDDEIVEEVGEDEEEEEEDSTQKIESNSLTTTVNEETSNSSVYATGDKQITYDKQESTDQVYSPSGLLVESKEVNRFISASQKTDELSSISDQDNIKPKTKETIDFSSNNNKNSHKNQISSANTNKCSSFQDNMLANQDSLKKDSNSLLTHEAKFNNTSNNRESQSAGQPDDQSAQEIILSWSNLVIK